MLLSPLSRSATRCTRSVCSMRRATICSAAKSIRLAVVGDVHGQWCPERDAAALQALDADFTLFVGDFGNESVKLVRQIAELDAPKAAILGNHDAWYTMTARRRNRSPSPIARHSPHGAVAAAPAGSTAHQQPAQHDEPDRVQQQLDALGDCHVGYSHQQLPGKQISLVGVRPFSKGGKSFSSIRDFLVRLYNVGDAQESALKVMDIINSQVPASNALILMGHNGPAGLGSARHNICGVDWVRDAGDHGDPDFKRVLHQLQEAGRHVALVVFGHMHHRLKGGDLRQMVHVDGCTGTVYLNAATVPRVVNLLQAGPSDAPDASKHHFLVVDLLDGQVQTAADVWVKVARTAESSTADVSHTSSVATTSAAVPVTGVHSNALGLRGSGNPLQQPQQIVFDQQQYQVDGQWQVQVLDVQEVLRTSHGSAVVKHYWDAFNGEWQQVELPAEAPAVPVEVLN